MGTRGLKLEGKKFLTVGLNWLQDMNSASRETLDGPLSEIN